MSSIQVALSIGNLEFALGEPSLCKRVRFEGVTLACQAIGDKYVRTNSFRGISIFDPEYQSKSQPQSTVGGKIPIFYYNQNDSFLGLETHDELPPEVASALQNAINLRIIKSAELTNKVTFICNADATWQDLDNLVDQYLKALHQTGVNFIELFFQNAGGYAIGKTVIYGNYYSGTLFVEYENGLFATLDQQKVLTFDENELIERYKRNNDHIPSLFSLANVQFSNMPRQPWYRPPELHYGFKDGKVVVGEQWGKFRNPTYEELYVLRNLYDTYRTGRVNDSLYANPNIFSLIHSDASRDFVYYEVPHTAENSPNKSLLYETGNVSIEAIIAFIDYSISYYGYNARLQNDPAKTCLASVSAAIICDISPGNILHVAATDYPVRADLIPSYIKSILEKN